MDSESRLPIAISIAIAISIGGNDTGVAVIHPASTAPIAVVCPLIMIEVPNIASNLTADSSQLVMIVVMMLSFCSRS